MIFQVADAMSPEMWSRCVEGDIERLTLCVFKNTEGQVIVVRVQMSPQI